MNINHLKMAKFTKALILIGICILTNILVAIFSLKAIVIGTISVYMYLKVTKEYDKQKL